MVGCVSDELQVRSYCVGMDTVDYRSRGRKLELSRASLVEAGEE